MAFGEMGAPSYMWVSKRQMCLSARLYLRLLYTRSPCSEREQYEQMGTSSRWLLSETQCHSDVGVV